jgi:hypothetical protein
MKVAPGCAHDEDAFSAHVCLRSELTLVITGLGQRMKRMRTDGFWGDGNLFGLLKNFISQLTCRI